MTEWTFCSPLFPAVFSMFCEVAVRHRVDPDDVRRHIVSGDERQDVRKQSDRLRRVLHRHAGEAFCDDAEGRLHLRPVVGRDVFGAHRLREVLAEDRFAFAGDEGCHDRACVLLDFVQEAFQCIAQGDVLVEAGIPDVHRVGEDLLHAGVHVVLPGGDHASGDRRHQTIIVLSLVVRHAEETDVEVREVDVEEFVRDLLQFGLGVRGQFRVVRAGGTLARVDVVPAVAGEAPVLRDHVRDDVVLVEDVVDVVILRVLHLALLDAAGALIGVAVEVFPGQGGGAEVIAVVELAGHQVRDRSGAAVAGHPEFDAARDAVRFDILFQVLQRLVPTLAPVRVVSGGPDEQVAAPLGTVYIAPDAHGDERTAVRTFLVSAADADGVLRRRFLHVRVALGVLEADLLHEGDEVLVLFRMVAFVDGVPARKGGHGKAQRHAGEVLAERVAALREVVVGISERPFLVVGVAREVVLHGPDSNGLRFRCLRPCQNGRRRKSQHHDSRKEEAQDLLIQFHSHFPFSSFTFRGVSPLFIFTPLF